MCGVKERGERDGGCCAVPSQAFSPRRIMSDTFASHAVVAWHARHAVADAYRLDGQGAIVLIFAATT